MRSLQRHNKFELLLARKKIRPTTIGVRRNTSMLSSRLILAARLRSAVGWCLIATFGLPTAAAAQVLYKSILPDGRIVYGDKPAPGAAKVIEKQPDPSTAGLSGTSAREVQLLEDFRKARVQREEKEEKVRAAEKALREAEAARDTGKDPLPGERLGIARRGNGAGKGTGTGTGTG